MINTFLIVEDNDGVRTSLREWLSAVFPRLRFFEACSGEEAVAQVQTEPPDIVLMDIGLPQINGIQATREIKACAPATKVVMLSIYDAPEYQADAQAAGAVAFVPKRSMHEQLIPVLTELVAAGNGNGKG